MAHDRYEPRGRYRGTDHDRRDEERGFFERAGDEIASWFGDDEAERRRRMDERASRERDYGREREHPRYAIGGWGERDSDRDRFATRGSRRGWDREDDRSRAWAPAEHDYRPRSSSDRGEFGSRGYGAPVGDYGPGYSGAYGYSGGFDYGYGSGSRRGYGSSTSSYDRSETPWGRDDYRRTSYAGSERDYDRDYQAWRQRQLNELDRDYELYNRERQERFERDFGTWRSNRLTKRQQLGRINEHMDVVGSDGETIGKVDKVRGDQVILTKSDSPDNRHHAIDCSMIDTVEGEQVRLNVEAEEARKRWRDEDRRGFFGRRDEEETNLERSFSGTYES